MQTINNQNYYSYEDVAANAPVFCKSARGARELIKKRKVPEEMYLFAREKKGEMIVTNGKSYKHDRVFFHEDYVNEHIPEMRGEKGKSDGVEEAPEIIELEDEEKFTHEGKVFEIETRGEREFDKIFFKVRDVEKEFGFEKNKLHDNIIQRDTYTHKEDYIFFNCIVPSQRGNSVKKELFITYQGMLRVILRSRSTFAVHFSRWVAETIFTHQMGSEDQKIDLGSKLINVSSNAVRAVFDKSATTLPCIYLFRLGTVKDLRAEMKLDKELDDDDEVCKYGLTTDIKRRTRELEIKYKHIKAAKLTLKLFTVIDPKYLDDAEGSVAVMMKGMDASVKYENEKELVVVAERMQNYVEKRYKELERMYRGMTAEIVAENNRLKHVIEIKDKDLKIKDQELKMKDQELKMKDQELRIKELELKMKDMEIRNA